MKNFWRYAFLPRVIFFTLIFSSFVFATKTLGQETAQIKKLKSGSEIFAPPASVRVDGAPPVTAALQKTVDSYSANYYLNPVVRVETDDSKQLVLTVKEVANPARLLVYRSHVSNGNTDSAAFTATPEVVLEIPTSDYIYGLYPSPDNHLYLYNADAQGDGQYRFYLYDPQTKRTTELISEGRNVEPVWSADGKQIAFGSAAAKQEGMSLMIADINIGSSEESVRKTVVAQTEFMLTAQDWSPDGKYLAYVEYFANRNSSALWLVNLKTNEKKLISPPEKFDVANGRIPAGEAASAKFSRDGKKLYFTANHGGEFVRLYAYDLTTGKAQAVTLNKNFDVEKFVVSPRGDEIAVIYDVNGASRLFVNSSEGVHDEREVKLSGIGVIQNLVWSDSGNGVAFNFASAQLPAAIFYADVKATRNVTPKLVAASPDSAVERAKLASAQLIEWKAADGLDLGGWMFKPSRTSAKNKTNYKLPVIVDIHGGPEDAARPEFSTYDSYYLNAERAAIIYPNVRGSTGRGKSFLNADNGLKRADAVKDFGKLFEWIAQQPDLDSKRIMLRGFSYGGYMALLVAATFPDKVAAVAVESAPSNLVTLLETTSGWRRAQRRNEYGDERDAAIRAGLEKIAPRNLSQNLRMPLFLAHGKRDPRVPAAESEKFVADVRARGNKNVWFMLAANDGHGLTGENDHYRSLLTALFFQKFVAGDKRVDSHKTQNVTKNEE